MAYAGISTNYDWTNYTPLDSSADDYDIFASAYKNLRFNVQASTQITITNQHIANFPGLAEELYGDTSLWRILLTYNGLSDPLTDLIEGMILLVPAKADITAYLSPQVNQTNQSVII